MYNTALYDVMHAVSPPRVHAAEHVRATSKSVADDGVKFSFSLYTDIWSSHEVERPTDCSSGFYLFSSRLSGCSTAGDDDLLAMHVRRTRLQPPYIIHQCNSPILHFCAAVLSGAIVLTDKVCCLPLP